jgi:osmotically inducible protein OsmC
MKKTRRTASVLWKSGAKGCTRSVSTESGALNETKFSFGIPLKSDPQTNPGELVAAALVSSFSLALSKELGSSAAVIGEIVTTATVKSEDLSAGWTITSINLNVAAKLPKITQGQFIDATVHAKMNCMVCRLLRVNITMNARLDKERS